MGENMVLSPPGFIDENQDKKSSKSRGGVHFVI